MNASLIPHRVPCCLFILILWLLAGSIMPAPALAKANQETEQTIDIDYETIESIGLYRKESEGSLGRDLWKNNKRSHVTALLRNMPVSSHVPGVQKMIFGVLLSATNAKLLENDVAPQPGHDLLTLRIEKLLEAGAYRQAFELYSKLEQEPYHENLARLGILSMLYSGEKSTACLETNMLQQHMKASEFWTTITAYCDFALSDKPSEESKLILSHNIYEVIPPLTTQEKYKFLYTPKKFEALMPLEQALLTAEKKINTKNLNTLSFKEIPQTHLQPLLTQNDLSEKNSLELTIQAVALGISESEALTELYVSMSAPAAGRNENIKHEPPKMDWKKLPYFYYKTLNAKKDQERWEFIRQTYDLVKIYGPAALIPFAKTVYKSNPENLSLEDTRIAYGIMNHAGMDISEKWQKKIYNIEPEKTNNNRYAQLITASYLSTPNYAKTKENSDKLNSSVNAAHIRTKVFLKNIMKRLDKPLKGHNNADDVYEKDFVLTFSQGYVMPSVDVWSSLLKASHTKAVGETVLLSTVIFRDQAVKDVYPRLLYDTLQGLENVGLTNVSENLATMAVLEDNN